MVNRTNDHDDDVRGDTHIGTRVGDALARLREGIEVPPVDPAREEVLLAAFDAHWAQRLPVLAQVPVRTPRWMWTTAAALMAMAVGLNWLVVTRSPRATIATFDPTPDVAGLASVAGFVAWPGADAWPPFESGSLVRVDLPVSALPALGLWPPSGAVNVVKAEIIVGQDGFARAVRLVQ